VLGTNTGIDIYTEISITAGAPETGDRIGQIYPAKGFSKTA
jgi:hypothetical protein